MLNCFIYIFIKILRTFCHSPEDKILVTWVTEVLLVTLAPHQLLEEMNCMGPFRSLWLMTGFQFKNCKPVFACFILYFIIPLSSQSWLMTLLLNQRGCKEACRTVCHYFTVMHFHLCVSLQRWCFPKSTRWAALWGKVGRKIWEWIDV